MHGKVVVVFTSGSTSLVLLDDVDLPAYIILQSDVIFPESIVFLLDFKMKLNLLLWVFVSRQMIDFIVETLDLLFQVLVGFHELLQRFHYFGHFLFSLLDFLFLLLDCIHLVSVILLNKLNLRLHLVYL